jgi:hypothetical protein
MSDSIQDTARIGDEESSDYYFNNALHKNNKQGIL